MNNFGKILTIVCLALFVVTLIYFPWLAEDGPSIWTPDDKQNAIADAIREVQPATFSTIYRFFLLPPNNRVRPDWSMACVRWVPLAVAYTALIVLFKSKDK